MKLRNKLLLSCVALAACATTMVSTTFAWYTSNKEVSASGVNGASASTGSELLLISTNGNTWGTTASVTLTGKALNPVSWNVASAESIEGVKLSPLNYSTGQVTGTENADNFISFDLYFKYASSETAELYVKELKFTNQTAASNLPEKPIIGDNKSNIDQLDEKGLTDTYTTDMLRALKVEIETTNSGAISDKIYDPEGLQQISTDSLTGSFSAIEYVKAVMGSEVNGSLTASTGATVLAKSGGTPWSLGTLPASASGNKYIKATFKIFLDGGDLACFDACQGQTFDLSLKFSTDSTGAIHTTA